MTRPDSSFDDAELEVVRIRDLLGQELSDVPVDTRIVARTLNRIDADERSLDDVVPGHATPEDVAGSTAASRHHGRWLLFAAAAAAIALIVTVTRIGPAAMASPPSLRYTLAAPEQTASAPAAEDVLLELAQVAGITPVPGQGAVQYLASYNWTSPIDGDAERATIRPISQRWWIGADGSMVAEQHLGAELTPDGALDPDPPLQAPDYSRDVSPAGSMPDVPGELPADAAELAEALLAEMSDECRSGPEAVSACLLEQVAWLYTTFLIPPDLASDIWQMLAAQSGVRTLGAAIDRLGRDVEAIAAPPRESGLGMGVLILLIDPETGRMVGTETVTLDTDYLEIDGPTVTGFTTLTDARLVTDIEG